MSKLLYINNELVDLYPDTVIAQTLQAFQIGKIGSVRANYTNSIRLPKTATNRRVLQFADDTKSSTSFPYTSYGARYVENGIEIIRNGTVVIREGNENDFSLTLYSGPIGFFDYIRTKTLWDLDFTDINSGWTNSERDAVRSATTGMVAPLLDDGATVWNGVIPAVEFNAGGAGRQPWVYYHTVINKIFSGAGVSKSGSIFSDDDFLKLAMPLTNTWSPRFKNGKGFSAAAPGNQSIADPAAYTTVTFDQVSHNGSDGFYDDSLSAYRPTNSDSSDEFFTMYIRTTLNITVTGGTVDIVLRVTNGLSNTDLGVSKTNVGTGTHYIGTGLYTAKDGDSVRVRIIKNTGTPNVTINDGVFEGEVVDTVGNLPAYTYFNHLFPEISQADMIRDFCVRFNVFMTEKAGTIYCKTFDEILAGASSAKDWSSKRASTKNRVQYSFRSLARANGFTYPTDDLIGDLPEEYGKGTFTIANENLDESRDLYESLFSMTDMQMFEEKIYMASVQLSSSDEPSLGIRLCYLRDASADDPTVYYDVSGRSTYKVAYFIDPRETRSMHWQYFIDNYYAGLVARLQKAKTVVRDYVLNDLDIHTFDQLVPVYDNGELFIVTAIKNYRSGKMTEVELFKI